MENAYSRGTVNVVIAQLDSLLRPGDKVTFAGVTFWKDTDGPWAGELTFSPASERWNIAAVLDSMPYDCSEVEAL